MAMESDSSRALRKSPSPVLRVAALIATTTVLAAADAWITPGSKDIRLILSATAFGIWWFFLPGRSGLIRLFLSIAAAAIVAGVAPVS